MRRQRKTAAFMTKEQRAAYTKSLEMRFLPYSKMMPLFLLYRSHSSLLSDSHQGYGISKVVCSKGSSILPFSLPLSQLHCSLYSEWVNWFRITAPFVLPSLERERGERRERREGEEREERGRGERGGRERREKGKCIGDAV